MVQTPVGMKCQDCGFQKSGTLFTLSPMHIIRIVIGGLILGAVAGWGVDYFGFYTIFLAIAYGTFSGEVLIRISGHKHGKKMEIIAVLSLIAGALGGRMLIAATLLGQSHIHPPLGVLDVIIALFAPTPIPIIALIIAIAGVIGRIRYI